MNDDPGDVLSRAKKEGKLGKKVGMGSKTTLFVVTILLDYFHVCVIPIIGDGMFQEMSVASTGGNIFLAILVATFGVGCLYVSTQAEIISCKPIDVLCSLEIGVTPTPLRSIALQQSFDVNDGCIFSDEKATVLNRCLLALESDESVKGLDTLPIKVGLRSISKTRLPVKHYHDTSTS